MDERQDTVGIASLEPSEVSRFADSYASFTRIINSLQRQYIELKDEFSEQNAQLAETNYKLVDMTRRNLAATEFLNSILTSVSVGIIAVDQDGRITQFNPAASMMLGLPEREVLGRHYRDVLPPGVPVDANALRAAESGRAVESVEKRLDLTDGTSLMVSVSTAILRDDEGRSQGAVEVFHDLTRLKRMEQEITRLTTLAALGEMAATIAHEVRNPLAGIGGFASLLKRDIPADDPRNKLCDKIISGVETLNRIVTTLLNYTRFDEINREEVGYGDFLRKAVEQFCHDNAERLGDVIIRLHPDELSRTETSPRIDPMLVRQLIFNLLVNALEACGTSGEVEISYRKLSRQAATERYGERLMLAHDETVIETIVVDTGAGLDQQHIEKIFSPFFTTKQNGTGLGLAVSWKIAKAHGGDIMAENSPTGGARFTFLLPAKIDHMATEHHI